MTKQEREELASKEVERYKAETGASNGQAALEALSIYHGYRLDPPNWAIETIRTKWEEFQTGVEQGMRRGSREKDHVALSSKRFDEVLGLEKPTSNQDRRFQHIGYQLYLEVKKAHREGHNLIAGTGGAFDIAGRKFGVGERTARDFCKRVIDAGAPPIANDTPPE